MEAPPPSPEKLSAELGEPFALPAGAIEYFRAEGYVKLKKLFSPELLKFYGEAITARSFVLIRSSSLWLSAQLISAPFFK